MKLERMISTVDTHTEGEPTRTILGGLPPLPGKTIAEKMIYMRDHMDAIRTSLLYEPRGNEVMSGVVVLDPCHPEADIGVIFIEVGGYLPMCGHDTIGCCKALLETGVLPKREPVTEIKLDTPAGLVTARVRVENGTVQSVSFTNIPSFLYMADVVVDVPEIGKVPVDIAYGGNFYALVDVRDVGLRVSPQMSRAIVQKGIAIRDAVNASVEVKHPEKPFIDSCTHVEFFTPPGDGHEYTRNAVVIPPGSIDRSPCGTGTSAKLATMYAKRQIGVNEVFVHESIIGSRFSSRIVEEVRVKDRTAVISEVTGRAFLTGFHQFIMEEGDPLRDGFLLGA
jgi:proline racemase